MQDMDIDNRI